MFKFFPISRRIGASIGLCLGLIFLFFSGAGAEAEKIPFLSGDSLAVIQAKIEANGYDFTVAPNWVTRLPREEREKLHSRHPSPYPAYRAGSSFAEGPLVVGSADALPTAFDWRNYQGHSYIGPIRDQGYCGSCYAFGACAAAEGVYNFASGQYDENCLDLSEAFLAFCLDQYYPGYSGCYGSSYDYEELDALVERGVCLETAYPYTGEDQGCVSGSEAALRVTYDGWYRIPCGYVDAIKFAIMTYGVVDAAVLVGDAFELYDTGIYKDSNISCDSVPCDYTPTNHCIALVGWDDNGGDGYWILRNSWGTGWGEDGYMRISYHAAHVSCAVCYLVARTEISGAKWNDYNADGSWDVDEPGISHWKIYIDANLNDQWDAGEVYTLTDQDGNYSFTGLNPGIYEIAEERQDGWSQTFPMSVAAAVGLAGGPSTQFAELSEQERGEIELTVIDSPPTPPVGHDRVIVRQFPRSAASLSNVPTSRWTYGCSATSAGMLFGYYDRTGYRNMYSGPTNGGVAPLTNLGQGATPRSPISGSCSLIASMDGFDGRGALESEPGHVDDYWVGYGTAGPDPWEGSADDEHVWGGCTADYMGTNQWKWDFDGDGVPEHNSDGSTVYVSYSSGAKLYDGDPVYEAYLNGQTALCRGLRLFAESRGYAVAENYNQRVDTNPTVVAGQGFTFADFKTEIDNGCPALIHVTGHTMLGVGYDDATQTIYLHDTWDNEVHSMLWGGDYTGMTLEAVTVIHLASPPAVHSVVLVEGEVVTGINFGNHGQSETDTVNVVDGLQYDAIQDAYDAAGDGDTIQVQIGNFLESPVFGQFDVDVFLDGGFDAAFSEPVGVTRILGTMTIEAGSVTLDRIVIQ
ncbi:MAG: C1 family peptidase [Pseudomonadota bacterium]|nr:C1 family peptidase [Pseudomonadota bacterium]